MPDIQRNASKVWVAQRPCGRMTAASWDSAVSSESELRDTLSSWATRGDSISLVDSDQLPDWMCSPGQACQCRDAQRESWEALIRESRSEENSSGDDSGSSLNEDGGNQASEIQKLNQRIARLEDFIRRYRYRPVLSDPNQEAIRQRFIDHLLSSAQ